MAQNKPTHYEASLQRDIDLIKSKIKTMFELDKRALQDVLRAFVENNRQRAYAVIWRDQRIDELEKEVDRLSLEFLVRQQPVALHLRFAYVTIKINQELERIGDYAESIARQVLKTSHLNQRPPASMFEEIANLTIPMLEDSVHAFLNQDAELAKRTMAMEEKIDHVRDSINAALYRMQKEGKIPLESLTPFLTMARRFERTSDQAKNICEEVVYMCTGDYAKHLGRELCRVLIVDDHNACRGQIAEGIAASMSLPDFKVVSAGLDPKPIDPDTVAFMQAKGIDISNHKSQSVEQVPNLGYYQIIIALSEASKKVFPKPPTKTVCLDWQVKDPSTIQGNPEAKEAALEETYQFIHTNLQDLSEAVLGDELD